MGLREVLVRLRAGQQDDAPLPDEVVLTTLTLRDLPVAMGVLSLVAIADGVFAKIRFRSGWQDLRVRPDDLRSVRTADVIALVDHAQQVSVETVDSLAQMLVASPTLSGTAAAALLVAALAQRARRRGQAMPGLDGDAASPPPTR